MQFQSPNSKTPVNRNTDRLSASLLGLTAKSQGAVPKELHQDLIQGMRIINESCGNTPAAFNGTRDTNTTYRFQYGHTKRPYKFSWLIVCHAIIQANYSKQS